MWGCSSAGEHLLCKQGVGSSILSSSTNLFRGACILRANYVQDFGHIEDAFLKGELVHGRRGVGVSTALRDFIHVLHEGEALVAFPMENLGHMWVEQYRRQYPNDKVPTMVTRDRQLRGRSLPLYVECWDMISAGFQRELTRYGIVNAVSTS